MIRRVFRKAGRGVLRLLDRRPNNDDREAIVLAKQMLDDAYISLEESRLERCGNCGHTAFDNLYHAQGVNQAHRILAAAAQGDRYMAPRRTAFDDKPNEVF